MQTNHKRYRAADDQGGNQTMFCPNCGKPVNATDEFCGNCGFNLKAYHAKSTASATAGQPASAASQTTRESPVAPTRSGHGTSTPTTARPSHPTPKWVWITVVVVVLVLIGGYLFGKNYYSRSAQLDRAVTAVKNGNKGVADYFSTSDPNLKLSDAKIAPLTKYFKSKPASLASFKRQLNAGQTDDDRFTYQLSGKAWLFFDKYTIHVKPVYPTATTNRDGAKISVDGKQVATSNSTSYSKQLGPLVPGNYKIAATGTVNGRKMTNTGTYYVDKAGQSIDLALRTISFTVETSPKTVVYVNNEKIGTADSAGELDVSELPWSGNLEVTGKYGSGSSTVTSKPYQVTSNDETVNLEFTGVMSLDDAKDYMDELWTAVNNVTSSGDESDASDDNDTSLSDYYVDGADNAQYKEMIRMAKGYYNDDDIYSVDYDCEVRSVVPTGKDKFTVTYYLTYTFELEDSTHTQEFSYNADMEKSGTDDYKIIKVTGGQKLRDTHEDD
ncbi:zinc-ribbon domain-containing protein [Lactiplantibacillus garii]|uniref:Zinc-ribbon domain-containing protein n=1 Tax=Lactiplantibacillus garii TaxID=2306423 RepID=A0A426DAY8_9LACO|nr:zinc-ribbon domain-containing protein [Lactiplantibacillus garii]RRK11752.1 zinc-ribbon domain-containing protein [Lactiplantibacillus garii]